MFISRRVEDDLLLTEPASPDDSAGASAETTGRAELDGKIAALLAESGRARAALALLTELATSPVGEEAPVAAEQVAGLLVPRIADGCLVEILERSADDGQGARTLIAAHIDAERRKALAAGGTPSAAHASVRLPLPVQGANAGYLTVWMENDRPFATADLGLVEVAARRVATALERRRLAAAVDDAL